MWLIFSFLTFATGYGLGLLIHKRHEMRLAEMFEDVEELLREMEELGFLNFDKAIGDDPTTEEIKRLLEQLDFSSNDEMLHPNETEENE